MSFVVIQGLFILGVILFVVGFLMNVACSPRGISNVGADVASALGLIVVYAFLIVAANSSLDFINLLGNGIPFINEIAEFGSLKTTFVQAPNRFVSACFQMIVLSMVVELVKTFFGAKHIFVNKRFSMTLFFTYFATSMIGLVIFNVIVAKSSLYTTIASTLGGFSATATVVMMVFVLVARKPLGLLGPVSNFFADAVFKTLLYIAIIWFMESFMGGFSNGVAFVIELMIGFGPILVLIIGIGIMLKSLKF